MTIWQEIRFFVVLLLIFGFIVWAFTALKEYLRNRRTKFVIRNMSRPQRHIWIRKGKSVDEAVEHQHTGWGNEVFKDSLELILHEDCSFPKNFKTADEVYDCVTRLLLMTHPIDYRLQPVVFGNPSVTESTVSIYEESLSVIVDGSMACEFDPSEVARDAAVTDGIFRQGSSANAVFLRFGEQKPDRFAVSLEIGCHCCGSTAIIRRRVRTALSGGLSPDLKCPNCNSAIGFGFAGREAGVYIYAQEQSRNTSCKLGSAHPQIQVVQILDIAARLK